MSGIKRKLAILFVTAAMCISALPVYAAGSGTDADTGAAAAENTAPKVQTFTIDKAIEYAKEHSRSMA
ncbi:MAG: hypothetical protein ACI38A_02985, partial [Candidatus Ornithomonoglobus sp.]